MPGTGCTITFIKKIHGENNQRVVVISLVVSGTTSWNLAKGNHGLEYIDYTLYSVQSLATYVSIGIKSNIRSGTTAEAGTLSGSGFTVGDVITVKMYGVG